MPLLPTGGFSAELGNLPISGGRRADAATDDPTSAALQSVSHMAQRAGNAYEEQVAQEETRKAQVGLSDVRARVAKELDDAALSGADTGKIREKMMADIDKIGEGFATKKGSSSVQIGAANAALMFDEQANRINVQRAFSQAKADTSKILNNESAIIATQPTYLPFAIENLNAAIDTYRISPEKKQELKDHLTKQLNMSAVLATIRTGDPSAVAKELSSGQYDLSPEQRELAQHAAASEKSRREHEANTARVEEHRQLVERSEASADNYSKQISDRKQSIAGLSEVIRDDPTLERRTREHLQLLIQQRTHETQNGEKKSNQEVYRQLYLDATAPDSDPRKILNGDKIFAAAARGDLNVTDAERLRGIVAGQKDENFRKIETNINSLSRVYDRVVNADPRLLGLDAAQKAEVINDYAGRIRDKVSEARAANDAPGLRALFDVNSKDYVGSAEFMRESIGLSRTKMKDALPQVPDLRAAPDAEVQVGQPFINSKGQQVVMTQAAFEARSKAQPAAPAAPELKRLPEATLKYNAAMRGIDVKDLNPYTGAPWAEPAPAPLHGKALPFDSARGGVQIK